MDRNTVSEGLLVRYDVRNGRYKPNRNQNKITGLEHAMGTYTPRILRGSEFFIGDSSQPEAVFSTDGAVRNSRAVKYRNRDRRNQASDVFVLMDDFSNDVTDDSAELLPNDSRQETLSIFESLKPYFFTMAAFGICNPCFNPSHRACRLALGIYSGVISLTLWANFVRLLCCFRGGEEHSHGFVLKICIIVWFICGTVSVSINQWTWSKSGFPTIFIQVQTLDFISDLKTREKLRNVALGLSIFGYIVAFAVTGFGLYAMFGFEHMFTIQGVDLAVCPSIADGDGVILKVLFIISLLLASSSWIFSLLQHSLVSFLLYLHFNKVNKDFQSALSEDRNVHRHFEKHRQRHLAVGDLVARVDRVTGLWASVTFLINTLTSFALISDLLLNHSSTFSVMTASGIFLLMSLLSLVGVLSAGVVVHHTGRQPIMSLLHHQIISASSENCLQINLFLYQLTHESRGLTIFRLFTVTKTTVLIVLCVFLTYVIVLLHMLPLQDHSQDKHISNMTIHKLQ